MKKKAEHFHVVWQRQTALEASKLLSLLDDVVAKAVVKNYKRTPWLDEAEKKRRRKIEIAIQDYARRLEDAMSAECRKLGMMV